MIYPGLCSITFRKLSVGEIIFQASKSGLQAIEWGGDVHVPPGNLEVAEVVRRMCGDVGLLTPSYGSYFRLTPDSTAEEFAPVLDTAQALGAKTVRVWADKQGSDKMYADYRRRLADAGHTLADAAARAGCVLAFEYHLGTATDTNESAAGLIAAINHPNTRLYWQPRQKLSADERVESLRGTLGVLAHLHVFQWVGERDERRPLAEGVADWRRYFALAAEAGGERCAYLEFVAGDDLAAFQRDAATLRELVGGA